MSGYIVTITTEDYDEREPDMGGGRKMVNRARNKDEIIWILMDHIAATLNDYVEVEKK